MSSLAKLASEYKTANNLRECLRQHAAFCLASNFDQIRDTDLVKVACCECGTELRLPYDSLSSVLFCETCKDTELTAEHLNKLKARLGAVQAKLLQI